MFLDIAWIKEKLPNAAEHIKKKLPSMYHQFKQLADIDITKEPMEIGPTTHYVMGGVRWMRDTQMSIVPGLFAAGECAAGLHGANRLGGNSLSDLLVFGKRAGEYAAKFAKENAAGNGRTWRRWMKRREGRWSHSSAERRARIRSRSSTSCRTTMQDLVGIVRVEEEMEQAVEEIDALKAARGEGRRHGQSRVQHRLAHGARPGQSADDVRDGRAWRRSSGRKAAAAISATIIRTRDAEWGEVNHPDRQGRRRAAAGASACRWCR